MLFEDHRRKLSERMSLLPHGKRPPIVFDHKPWWFHAFIGDVGFRVRVTAWMRIPLGKSGDDNSHTITAGEPVVRGIDS